MALLAPFLVLCACVWRSYHVEAAPDTLSSLDSSFCHGDLQMRYPELDVEKCLVILDVKLRKKVSTVWKEPQVFYTAAQKKKMYVLVMVDPDAPSHKAPTSALWRHWLVVDIKGSSLKTGEIEGTTLTEYRPPTPPPGSGFHRYQFMLYEQPANAPVSLSDAETSSRGKWDLQAFVARFDLGAPVAAVQFLTQNYKD